MVLSLFHRSRGLASRRMSKLEFASTAAELAEALIMAYDADIAVTDRVTRSLATLCTSLCRQALYDEFVFVLLKSITRPPIKAHAHVCGLRSNYA